MIPFSFAACVNLTFFFSLRNSCPNAGNPQKVQRYPFVRLGFSFAFFLSASF